MKSSNSLFIRVGLVLLYLTFLSACTHDHRVQIEPELYVRSKDWGQGQRIALKVSDRRQKRAIYEESMGPQAAVVGSFNKVNIYPRGAVDDPIEDQVKKALTTLGFVPVNEKQEAEGTLEIQVLQLRMLHNYEDPKIKIPEKKVRLKAALGVIARKGGKKFKKLYKSQLDKSQNLLTGEVKNERFINNGISTALQKIFEDQSFLLFLSPEQ